MLAQRAGAGPRAAARRARRAAPRRRTTRGVRRRRAPGDGRLPRPTTRPSASPTGVAAGRRRRRPAAGTPRAPASPAPAEPAACRDGDARAAARRGRRRRRADGRRPPGRRPRPSTDERRAAARDGRQPRRRRAAERPARSTGCATRPLHDSTHRRCPNRACLQPRHCRELLDARSSRARPRLRRHAHATSTVQGDQRHARPPHGDALLREVGERLRGAVGGARRRWPGSAATSSPSLLPAGRSPTTRARRRAGRCTRCEEPVVRTGDVEVGASPSVSIGVAGARSTAPTPSAPAQARRRGHVRGQGAPRRRSRLRADAGRDTARSASRSSPSCAQAIERGELDVHVPAQGRPRHRRGDRRRGAGPLAPPRARHRPARRVHPARRAQRPHPPADPAVLRRGAAPAAPRGGAAGHDLRVAVNLSARSLLDPDLADDVARPARAARRAGRTR